VYPRVIEVCRLPFEPRHDLFTVVELFPAIHGTTSSHFADS
jgi:hypothetical protein